MKRLISALLVVLMLLSLVGCGSSAPSDDSALEDETISVQHADGSGEYLKDCGIPKEFGVAQYSVEEIKQMKNYSAEELQAAIATIADMVQYIIENNYGDNPLVPYDLQFDCGEYQWSVNKSPSGALLSQSNSCGSVSNLARYVLEDDYDEEGYVGWLDRFADTGAGGGHIFNYFKQGDLILTIDFTIPITDSTVDSGNLWIVKDFEEVATNVLAKTKQHPSQANRVFVAVFIERDVHRDHAPRASINLASGELVCFIDTSFESEILLLHFDDEWLKGEGASWYEYHPFFESTGITEDSVPRELIDSADMTYYGEVSAPIN